MGFIGIPISIGRQAARLHKLKSVLLWHRLLACSERNQSYPTLFPVRGGSRWVVSHGVQLFVRRMDVHLFHFRFGEGPRSAPIEHGQLIAALVHAAVPVN